MQAKVEGLDAGPNDSDQFSLGTFENRAPTPHSNEFNEVAHGNVLSGQHQGSNDSDIVEYLKPAKADVVDTSHGVFGDHFLQTARQWNNVGHNI